MTNLRQISYELRLDVLEMVYKHKSGHIGGSMSCMDILTTLYGRVLDTERIRACSPDRDRFILSKGHCAEALYAVLARFGLIDKTELNTFTEFGTRLAEHPTAKIPGVEAATGALGHGLSLGVGMAIGLRADNSPAHVYVLTGDGELAEGSVWEAMMSASKYNLDNLTLIVDRNRLQITGSTEDVMPLDDLCEKLSAFGFSVTRCDGHDYDALERALRRRTAGQPAAIVAQTVKGKGSPVMEDKADWHHLIPNGEQYEQIKADLAAVLEEV